MDVASRNFLFLFFVPGSEWPFVRQMRGKERVSGDSEPEVARTIGGGSGWPVSCNFIYKSQFYSLSTFFLRNSPKGLKGPSTHGLGWVDLDLGIPQCCINRSDNSASFPPAQAELSRQWNNQMKGNPPHVSDRMNNPV